MIPWRYKVTWDSGRTEEVTIRFGDVARFEAKAGKSVDSLLAAKAFTSWCDALLVYTTLTRLKVEPVQSFDEFLDTADLELLEFVPIGGGASPGKAQGRAASSGKSPRSRSTAAKTR